MEIDAAVQRAVEAATAGRCLLVAGLVFIGRRLPSQHTSWQFSLSHWGRPPVIVSMHWLRRDAEAQLERVQLLNRAHGLRDDAAFAALVTTLAAFSDGEVA
ncbi:MAG TPA: hypothetical protein VLA19_12060 [Herpetosiphonaceae bacterium]|nr:hypothetical protein [Herpetosiphonaceae bacterium]